MEKLKSIEEKYSFQNPSYTLRVSGLILIPINANPMQVLFGAFQKITISKNTLSHVSRTFQPLAKNRYCPKLKKYMPYQYYSGIVVTMLFRSCLRLLLGEQITALGLPVQVCDR